jgi:hypothetical protein
MSVSFSFTGSNCRKRITSLAAQWYISKYIGDRYKFAVDFIARGLAREGMYGCCSIVDSCSRPREFVVEIHNRLDIEDYLTVLFHELIHVKQRILREHVTRYNKNYWYSRKVSEDTPYEDEPWEVEAHGTERLIYEEFCKCHTGLISQNTITNPNPFSNRLCTG